MIAAGTLAGGVLSRRFSGRGLTVAVAVVLILTGLGYAWVSLR